MDNKLILDELLFDTIENIKKRFTPEQLVKIEKALGKRSKEIKKYKNGKDINETVQYMRESFEECPGMEAVRWRLYGPDENNKKTLAYLDGFNKFDPIPDPSKNHHWDSMDDFATETDGKIWGLRPGFDNCIYLMYKRDFKDFEDYTVTKS